MKTKRRRTINGSLCAIFQAPGLFQPPGLFQAPGKGFAPFLLNLTGIRVRILAVFAFLYPWSAR